MTNIVYQHHPVWGSSWMENSIVFFSVGGVYIYDPSWVVLLTVFTF